MVVANPALASPADATSGTNTHTQSDKRRGINKYNGEIVIQLCYQVVRDRLWQHPK